MINDIKDLEKACRETAEAGSEMLKAHVKTYTRKDGTVVKEHDDSRQKKDFNNIGVLHSEHDNKTDARAAVETLQRNTKKPVSYYERLDSSAKHGKKYSVVEHYNHDQSPRKNVTIAKEHDDSRHPQILGRVTNMSDKDAIEATSFDHNGNHYYQTGKKGKSMHDDRPVREFEADNGHRVWLDHHGNVHADSKEEADRHHKRGIYAAHDHPSTGKKPAKEKESPKEKESRSNLKNHPMWSESDHAYFKGKGYTDNEIKAIWDRDHAAGHDPVVHKKAPDVVGVVADPDHYKKNGRKQ